MLPRSPTSETAVLDTSNKRLSMNHSAHQLAALVYESCDLLDASEFDQWMQLCVPDFRYRISTYSHEIRKEMLWADYDLVELGNLFKGIPGQLVALGTYRRHVGQCREVERDDRFSKMESSLVVYHTDLQGKSNLFAVARYVDLIDIMGEHLRLSDREVRLETRLLDFGPHVIL